VRTFKTMNYYALLQYLVILLLATTEMRELNLL